MAQPKPAPEVLSSQDVERLTALIPQLGADNAFVAMGEFSFHGKNSVPFLAEALKSADSKIRRNAMTVLTWIKDPSSAPALYEMAMDKTNPSGIRTNALKAAVSLNSSIAAPSIVAMAKDENATVRGSAAFWARAVKQQEVLPALVDLLGDAEMFVTVSALASFSILTGFAGTEPHPWNHSFQKDRQKWSQEFYKWIEDHPDVFGAAGPKQAG
ncbi:MAG: HEAT repeat domain-containing protein [Myxococcota bacterium]